MLRIGIIGAGENTRKKHIPGFRAISGVEIVAVCNRRPESTRAVVSEFGIPRTHSRWQDLVADPNIDAVVIGTWPYLHCPITLAALNAGKHVLTEARMSLNAAEAHRMRETAQKHSKLVTQIVPSPFGLTGNAVMKELLASGYLGELREYHVYSIQGGLADPESPLSWRQDEVLSGFNMLTLGILHETLLRWLPQPARVMAQAGTFIPTRFDSGLGLRRPAGTPDSVQAITRLPNGARGIYQFSGVVPFGTGNGIRLFGSKGALFYDLTTDRIHGAQKPGPLEEIPIPKEKAGSWRVEADFVDSIREGKPVQFTSFDLGVDYMEFTEAVARSALTGVLVELPLADVESEADASS
jgi:predicted dehydrogenase